MHAMTLLAAALAVPLLAFSPAAAEDYSLSKLEEAPPADVAEALSSLLEKHAVRVLDGAKKPLVDVWLRKQLPLPKDGEAAEGGVALGKDLADGSFLGVIRYHRKHADFRDKSLKDGVYTMRYGIQPMDGDHLGVSETRDFVLLAPLKKDTKADPIPTKELVELSTEVSGSSHPSIVYLISTKSRKAPETFPALLALEDRGWKVLDFRIPYEKAPDRFLRLGLVVVGKSDAL
jgi:hypothetical protein